VLPRCSVSLSRAVSSPGSSPLFRSLTNPWLTGISVLTFVFALMNKHKEKQRVAHGKPAKIIDTSMHKVYQAAPDDEVAGGYRLGDQAFLDLTDVQNDEVGASLFLLLTVLMKSSSLSLRTERLTIWNEFMRTTHRLSEIRG
jgi:hypothetical protein